MKDRNKKTTKLSKELSFYIHTHSKKGEAQARLLQTAWEKIASPRALEHTDNITFSKNTKKPELLIYVDNSHWAAELGTQKELYRILLERETKLKINDIKFLVTKKAAYKKAFIKWREKATQLKGKEKAVPLTKEEEKYVRELVSQIKNEKLRNQLFNAMKADLEWKKGIEALKLSKSSLEAAESI